MSLRELGEERVVEKLLEVASRVWPPLLKPGDDAAGMILSGIPLLLKIDGFSLNKFKLPWWDLGDVGWRAVMATASDLVAKGAEPKLVAVSIGVPGDTSLEELLELEEGIVAATERLGALLAGGDVNEAREPWIDVAILGLAEKIVPGWTESSGVLYTTSGRYGLTSILYLALKHGFDPPRYAVEACRRFEPRLGFLKLLREVGNCILAATDVSDGFFRSLRRIARMSRAYIIVEKLPNVDSTLAKIASEYGYTILDMLALGGEEYEIVFVASESCIDLVEEKARQVNLEIERLGFVIHSREYVHRLSRAAGVQWGQCTPDKPIFITGVGCITGLEGWDQFRGWFGGKYR